MFGITIKLAESQFISAIFTWPHEATCLSSSLEKQPDNPIKERIDIDNIFIDFIMFFLNLRKEWKINLDIETTS